MTLKGLLLTEKPPCTDPSLLPIDSPRGQSVMCGKGAGEQKERGEVYRGQKGYFYEDLFAFH